ncbi:hypothetical protein PTKIN_Ptkin01aG0290700 [Pterospermum kingtungense]
MDGPESEWEIQVPSGANNGDGKLGWMLKLGRKILVTGIVISSAPLVLPPLMAISAVGLVCSIPYGIFLVSYACTETIMSRLLPMPSPAGPLLLEYREAFNGEEEANEDENQGGQNEVIEGSISIERDEKEWKEDIIEEVEMRIELVDMEKGESDNGNALQGGAYEKGGVEYNEKKSMGDVDEIVEENRHEKDVEVLQEGVYQKGDAEYNEKKSMGEVVEIVEENRREKYVEILDEGEEMPYQSFEIEVKGIAESEQPMIEEIRSEQPADEDQDVVAMVEGDEKHSSNFEKETPMETENVNVNEELTRETRQNVENVDAQRKPKKKAKKGKGKKYIDKSANEQQLDDIHGFVTTSEGDKKERDNANKQTTVELKKLADVEKDVLVRESRRSLERNGKKGRSRDAAEDKQGVENAQVDVKVKLLKGNEGTTERNLEELLIEESLGKQPVDKVTDVLGGLKGSEKKQSIDAVSDIVLEFEGDEKKNGSNIEKETPFQMKKVDVRLSDSTDIDGDEELVRETRGLLEKIRDEGKTDYAPGDKWSTNATTEKDDKRIVGDVEEAKTSFLAHAGMEKPIGEFATEVEENKAVNNAEYGNENNVEQNYLLNKVQKDVIFSDKDEQGLDLLESSSTVSQQGSPSDVNTFGESQPSSSYSVHQESSDSSDLPVSTKVQESDDIRISAENTINTASNEALYGEEIWEQINALRTIVGYKAAPQETCIEELEALYLFTGITPPASFKDISDLADVNSKLRFLKSVVGVK